MNGGTVIIMIAGIIISFWWQYGFAITVFSGCSAGIVNVLADDLNKDRKIKRLEEQVRDLKVTRPGDKE